jgi:hypothetical protein
VPRQTLIADRLCRWTSPGELFLTTLILTTLMTLSPTLQDGRLASLKLIKAISSLRVRHGPSVFWSHLQSRSKRIRPILHRGHAERRLPSR